MADGDYPFGYCTNVHAGPTLSAAKENLLQFASAVRGQVAPSQRLPIGLWLSENAASSLNSPALISEFSNWLRENNFAAYTFNGFPQGDFHQPVVKHAVYEPTWEATQRRDYTLALAGILKQLSPVGDLGSISTLPLGWPHQVWSAERKRRAAQNLKSVASELDRIRQQDEIEIVIAIEPEPGCVLNTAAEIVEFFEEFLLNGPDAERCRRHLTVCHDVCHSSVMFEPQFEALQSYLEAGIRVGKAQISSAVHVPWDLCQDSQAQTATRAQLDQFNEPKYLHQATRCDEQGRLLELCEDLPQALDEWFTESAPPQQAWRVHFHVPLHIGKFGCLATTQADIAQATQFLEANRHQQIAGSDWFTGHYEVETYAWPVLPPDLAASDLASGIAQEMKYLEQILLPHQSGDD